IRHRSKVLDSVSLIKNNRVEVNVDKPLQERHILAPCLVVNHHDKGLEGHYEFENRITLQLRQALNISDLTVGCPHLNLVGEVGCNLGRSNNESTLTVNEVKCCNRLNGLTKTHTVTKNSATCACENLSADPLVLQ